MKIIKRDQEKRKNGKKLLKKIKKQAQGITLIALVVTVIVLLILAGVAINLTVGDNGLFRRAQNAVDTYEQASEKEKIELAIGSTFLDETGDFSITKSKLENALRGEFGNDTEISVEENEDGSFIINIDGTNNKYYVGNDTEIFIIDRVLTAAEIASNAQKYYGASVLNYDIDKNVSTDWNVFYSDDINIYLIASNYIEHESLPKNLSNVSLDKGDTDYKVYMDSIVNNYKESDSVTDSRIYKLNQKFFETDFTTTSSVKALSYFWNPNIWNEFCDINYAEFAIGGPTIEMLLSSYNQKYNTNYETLSTNLGYQISLDGGNTFLDYYIDNEIINVNDLLYNMNNNETIGMWLASPSNRGNTFLMCLQLSGTITGAQYKDNKFGIRPIICLKEGTKVIVTNNNNLILTK